MIAENIKNIRERISKKCAEVHRSPADIKLVAVSKYFGLKAIDEARKHGIPSFGENKAQELAAKYEQIRDAVEWHFIGTLQRNKVKYVVKSATYIHSIDSAELAQDINTRAGGLGKIIKGLVQVKTSDEKTKSGAEDEESARKLVELCSKMENIELVGLMTMAPFTDNVDLIRRSFNELCNLKNSMNREGYSIKELSMGMTSDFEIAIEEGATILRIGSAIFGERDYSKDWRSL